MSRRTLNVWYENKKVGVLYLSEENSWRFGFDYEDSWIKTGFKLSHTMPLSKKSYKPEEKVAAYFFSNLLPEERARNKIVAELGISDTDFNLLEKIGGECAGALSILSSGQLPNDNKGYNCLDEKSFYKMLISKGSLSSLTSKNSLPPRLSLAGAQDKCPVLYKGGQYLLPKAVAPTSHIIKFDISGYKNVPAYECLLTDLARSIGLPVIECEYLEEQGIPFLLVKRYDRQELASGDTKRLHQEDFCQALGLSSYLKYEEDGGVTFKDCYFLIKKVSTDVSEDTINLIKWQMFNLLAGNSDGHAKNLSIIYKEKANARLAPFYDLVCTRALAKLDTKLGLSVGGRFKPGDIRLKQWLQLADDCGISHGVVKTLLKEVATSLIDNIDKAINTFESKYKPYPALQRVKQVLVKQCERTLSELK